MAQSRPLLTDFEELHHDEPFENEKASRSLPTRREYVSALIGIVSSYFIWLLPRCLRYGPRREKKTHSTSYLDALRGIAASCVAIYHTFAWKNHWTMDLPFTRFLVNGRGMVDVFFVISGYVLSYRMLKFIRNKDATRLLDAAASATFRRYFRLYASSVAAAVWAFGLYQFGSGPYGKDLPPLPFYRSLWDFIRETGKFLSPFGHVIGVWQPGMFTYHYVPSLWTIPVEYRGSMMIYVFLILSSKFSTKNRMFLTWVIVILSYSWGAIYVADFFMGTFLADLSFTRRPESLGAPRLLQPELNAKFRRRILLERCLAVMALIFGWILINWPVPKSRDHPHPWPYGLLWKLTPPYHPGEYQYHFWPGIAAFFIIGGMEYFPALQTPLKWRFPQYLGELSFGIYLVHFPLLWTIYDRVLKVSPVLVWGRGEWRHLIPQIIYYFIVFWAAEIFTEVDNKVVVMARWMEKKTFQW